MVGVKKKDKWSGNLSEKEFSSKNESKNTNQRIMFDKF